MSAEPEPLAPDALGSDAMTTATMGTDTLASEPLASEPLALPRRPRLRWAAIIWGAIGIVIAVVTIAITGSIERRTAFLNWAAKLSAGDIWLLVVLAVGALVLLFGVLAALRRR